MLYFNCDYLEGAHPQIMRRLVETNAEQTEGYGEDPYCQSARERIRLSCAQPEAEVFFLVGGTQANATVIDGLLRPWECVLSASTGHIAVHEAGAIEGAGHKVVELAHDEGRLLAETIDAYMSAFLADPTHEHMPAPALVYLSYTTEYGTLYSLEELEAIRQVCDTYGLALFIDGARLGYGLVSSKADVTLADIARLCDAFTIGGTKVGALFGEALVFSQKACPAHFFTLMKQRGAVLAKGRLLGLQFDTLFTDDLYFTIARHAVDLAMKLKAAFLERGYLMPIDSPTNQQFVVLENNKLAELEKQVVFSFWEPYDENHTVVRFATSWATKEEDLEALIALL